MNGQRPIDPSTHRHGAGAKRVLNMSKYPLLNNWKIMRKKETAEIKYGFGRSEVASYLNQSSKFGTHFLLWFVKHRQLSVCDNSSKWTPSLDLRTLSTRHPPLDQIGQYFFFIVSSFKWQKHCCVIYFYSISPHAFPRSGVTKQCNPMEKWTHESLFGPCLSP